MSTRDELAEVARERKQAERELATLCEREHELEAKAATERQSSHEPSTVEALRDAVELWRACLRFCDAVAAVEQCVDDARKASSRALASSLLSRSDCVAAPVELWRAAELAKCVAAQRESWQAQLDDTERTLAAESERAA